MIGGVCLVVALASGPATVPAPADDAPREAKTPDAAERAEARAKAAFEDERWADAAAALDEAYRARPDPKFLFARAQALRFAGRCSEAVVTYERFIAESPSEAANALAREAIELCGGASQPAVAEAPPEPAPEAPPPTQPVEPRPAPTRPWWRDPAGHALLWPGVALTAAGSVLLPLGSRAGRVAPDARSEGTYLDELDRANAMRATGITLVAVGAVTIIAGVVRFAVKGRTKGRTHARTAARSFGLRF